MHIFFDRVESVLKKINDFLNTFHFLFHREINYNRNEDFALQFLFLKVLKRLSFKNGTRCDTSMEESAKRTINAMKVDCIIKTNELFRVKAKIQDILGTQE